jgi:hypothetical protein
VSILQRLGGWRIDDGVPELATAADWHQLANPGGDVAQVADLPPGVAAAFGLLTDARITREEAMRVPTVRRARSVICGTIGAQPLVAHRTNPDGQVVDVTDESERRLLRQPNPNTTLQYELTWTVDDLWFRGVSWWRITGRDATRFPSSAERIAPERIRLDFQRMRVYVDGEWVPDADLIRFDGPDEGLLSYAGSTLSTSRQLEAAVRRLASGDVPLGILKLAEGASELDATPGSAAPLTGVAGDRRSEVDLLLEGWNQARQDGSWAYMNRAIDAQPFQKDAREQQLAESRQQQRVDEANVCNVPPRVVNAPVSQPMTYTNALAERADLIDTSLLGYLVAIEQRLSLGDVTPRGTVVRFDLTRYLQGDTLSALQAMTPDEVRTDVLGRVPLTPEQRRQLVPPTPPASPTPQEADQ